MRYSRRAFLGTITSVAGGRGLLAAPQTGLEAFGADTLPCVLDVKATPAVSRDANYKAGAPMRTAIVAPGQKGTPLELTGIVAGLSCGPIANAIVEFWQPDASGTFTPAGMNLRGRQRTDSTGRYRLSTIIPGSSANRAPSIGVHVIVERKAELWTALFFPGQAANARDSRFNEALLVTLGGSAASRTGSFDIRLDL